MIADIVFVAVTTVIMTLLTADRKKWFTLLKRNAVTAGLLLTVIQLMILVTRLESASAELPDFNGIVISVLVKFRPLLTGVFFWIVLSVGEEIHARKSGYAETAEKASASENTGGSEPRGLDYSLLSRREIEVARLAAKGYTNVQIADELFISTETVKSHMNAIFEKLHISSRKDLMLQ